jgi:hypothetical protein
MCASFFVLFTVCDLFGHCAVCALASLSQVVLSATFQVNKNEYDNPKNRNRNKNPAAARGRGDGPH